MEKGGHKVKVYYVSTLKYILKPTGIPKYKCTHTYVGF